MSAPQASSSNSVGQRKGTRQEVFESRGKRGTPGSSTTPGGGAKQSPYSNPLPLYISNNESLSLLWSLTWTLSLSCQVLAAHLKSNIKSRNKIPKSAYLDKKIQGYWDERTKSVWVLPTARKKRRSNRSERGEGKNSDKQVENGADGTNVSSTSNIAQEQEEAPWMDQLWKKGFFGKGSLSRSEPTWWQREKNRVTGEHGKRILPYVLSSYTF